MTHDEEELIPTLQLLLGDLPDGRKRDLFCKAFPDSFMLVRVDAIKLGVMMRQTREHLQEIYDKVDGSSPLGGLAVQQVRHQADFAILELSKAAYVLGIKIGNMP